MLANNIQTPIHNFAMKEVKESPNYLKDDIQRELRVLIGLSQQRHSHDHLIALLDTFLHNDQYYLVFPWAHTDLQNLWRDDIFSKDDETALWVAKQCHGLASGLSTIHHWNTYSPNGLLDPDPHNAASVTEGDTALQGGVEDAGDRVHLFGRHGDIKPTNILWFPGRGLGILKIADFGTVHFSKNRSVSTQNRRSRPDTSTYRAPECDRSDLMLCPSADIWALGCVYLEFITWLFGGWNGVECFAFRRLTLDPVLALIPAETDTFFHSWSDGRPPEVKASVTEVSTVLVDCGGTHADNAASDN